MSGGYGQLWNELVERAILHHLPGWVLKVYAALLIAARTKTLSCYPTVGTLARWSGVPESKVSQATRFLEQHRLIAKSWIQMGGKPRKAYRLIPPADPMFPDLRQPCQACMNTDYRHPAGPQDWTSPRQATSAPRTRSSDGLHLR